MADYRAGQCWRYRTPEGFEASRLTVGATITFDGHEQIICAMVSGAPQLQPDRSVQTVDIPFIPLTATAFSLTVIEPDGTGPVTEHFRKAYEVWKADIRGLSYFTVPFEGFLDRMIRRQMAEIIDE